jgi:hypothetical protein
MAGGEHARIVVCMTCGARAERTQEGDENDLYRCDNGHGFGIDWAHSGPPAKPLWPLSEEERTMVETVIRMRNEAGKKKD